MKITDFHKITKSLSSDEREHWVSLLRNSLCGALSALTAESVADFAVALYAGLDNRRTETNSPIIGYAAGNIAKEFIPQILRHTEISEIWDAYSASAFIYGIPIVRPRFQAADTENDVVIFIEDSATRYDVASLFASNGYSKVFSYREYISILEAAACFPNIDEIATDKTKQVLCDFISHYKVLDDVHPQVNYSVIPKGFESVRLLNLESKHTKSENLSKRLSELLITADNVANGSIVHDFANKDFNNAFDFAHHLELFLRKALANGVKTKERPIRMHEDRPYDQFSVFAAAKEAIEHICGDFQKSLYVTQLLRKLSPDSVPLISAECYFLARCNRLEDALLLSREAIKKEPNGLLSNETFFSIAAQCKKRGIQVSEPLPDYDLSERFCWSGLTFALCYGFDSKNNSAEFLPCFRTLQCAASPAGDFWSGEEWVEFRKSILDGSFKYCQKNHCSNIAAGWLPKKAECNNTEVQRIIDGDFTVMPPLEELHLSYDFHCNMKCLSCRLEYKTNSAERNTELDALFEKNLRPLLENAKHLCLSGCGEAIISPHSRRVLQSLSNEKYPELAVELRTNVVSFNPGAWRALGTGRESIKHVAASVDASSKELFERLRYPGKWEVALEGLAFIQSLRNAGEVDMFEFHVVVQTENIDELVDIIKLAVKFDADAVTFSRLINWRCMTENDYHKVNPFWEDNPEHGRLMQVIDEIISLRDAIEKGGCELTAHREKKLFINMHCVADPSTSYDVIRMGGLKIR